MKLQQVLPVGAHLGALENPRVNQPSSLRATLQATSRSILLIVGVAAVFSSVAATGMWAQSTSPALPKRLVADYGYWSKYQTPPYGAAQIPINMMTHILHAGINIDGSANGTIDIPDGFIEPELISKAHSAGRFGAEPLGFRTAERLRRRRYRLGVSRHDRPQGLLRVDEHSAQ